MGSMPSSDGSISASSTSQIPSDMTPPTRQAPKPWIEIPKGNITGKKKEGSREGMVTSNTPGAGTQVPS